MHLYVTRMLLDRMYSYVTGMLLVVPVCSFSHDRNRLYATHFTYVLSVCVMRLFVYIAVCPTK